MPGKKRFADPDFMAGRAKRRELELHAAMTDTDAGADVDEAVVQLEVEAFVQDEVNNASKRMEANKARSAGGTRLMLIGKLPFFTRESRCIIDRTNKLMADNTFCKKKLKPGEVDDKAGVPNFTATQQAIFAACSPLLARHMPAFAIAAQPGAGKTLMSILAAVRWTLGGVAERRWHELNPKVEGPRPYMRASEDGASWSFVSPSSAVCLYVVPAAVLPQTVKNFERFVPMFALQFESRPAISLDPLYSWDPVVFPAQLVDVASASSFFWCTETEEYWFAPMHSSQWAPFTPDNVTRRLHTWNSASAATKYLGAFKTDVTVVPTKIMDPRNKYELRIAFTTMEDLLKANLNHDPLVTGRLSVEDYFAREQKAVLNQGLQALATPRVRYVICDEFHQPLERVTVDGSPVHGFFAHPGASNLLNLIGSKTANAHIFCDPHVDAMIYGPTTKNSKPATILGEVGGTGPHAGHDAADFFAKFLDKTKLRAQQVMKDTAKQQPLSVDFIVAALSEASCRSTHSKSAAPLGWWSDQRPHPMVLRRDLFPHYGTQSLLMTGTPPDVEATALWVALCQPVNRLSSGGFVLQTRLYSDGERDVQTTILLPKFLWRFACMGSGGRTGEDRDTPDRLPHQPKTKKGEPAVKVPLLFIPSGRKVAGPTTDEMPPEIGDTYVANSIGAGTDYASYVGQCAEQGCIIAFVGSKQTTPYWHYEFFRGVYPVLTFDGANNRFSVTAIKYNGDDDGPCENLKESEDLYNTMTYGAVCPTRVVPTDQRNQAAELEDWQSVWYTIKNILSHIDTLVDPTELMQAFPSTGRPLISAGWKQYQMDFLKVIAKKPRVLVVYAGPAQQWPVFIDSVPDDDDFGVGWLGPSAFMNADTLADAIASASSSGAMRTGAVTVLPPDGFPSQKAISDALEMGTKEERVNLFLLNAHSSTGIDLPGINVVIYVGDEGNKEQMLSRSSRLCKAMTGVDPTDGNGLGSFVVFQILPEMQPYRFTDQIERQQRAALTRQGLEECFKPGCSMSGACASLKRPVADC